MQQLTILALEQALTLPYATQRFVQMGARVIRIESRGKPGSSRPGDPNRYIGEETGWHDRHAYFIAPNVGKEAITINLKEQAGRDLLQTLVHELDVDIFLCNTLPKRYEALGIDYASLSAAKEDLIWCGISALGPEFPDRAGYDPALQALLGYMHLTGEPDRDPMLCGLPLIDLKAGDEAFTQVLLALLEKGETGKGKRIDISMARCAASWLITALPQLQFAAEEDRFTRSGNEHRSFIPSNCYPTKDGWVYLAIGSDVQWSKLLNISGFGHLARDEWEDNNGRKRGKEEIYAGIRQGLTSYTTAAFVQACLDRQLAVSPVNCVADVAGLDFVDQHMVKTTLPSGRNVPLFPSPMDTPFLESNQAHLAAAPGLGEHNHKVFSDAGLSAQAIQELEEKGVL